MQTEDRVGSAEVRWPACVGLEEAAQIMGWPLYWFPVLIRKRHLRPLGKPSQNGRKWFATVELERLGRDREWLDKAVLMVERHVQDANVKQRAKSGSADADPAGMS